MPRIEIPGWFDLRRDEGAEEADADSLADRMMEELLERGPELVDAVNGWTATEWDLWAVPAELSCATCAHPGALAPGAPGTLRVRWLPRPTLHLRRVRGTGGVGRLVDAAENTVLVAHRVGRAAGLAIVSLRSASVNVVLRPRLMQAGEELPKRPRIADLRTWIQLCGLVVLVTAGCVAGPGGTGAMTMPALGAMSTRSAERSRRGTLASSVPRRSPSAGTGARAVPPGHAPLHNASQQISSCIARTARSGSPSATSPSWS